MRAVRRVIAVVLVLSVAVVGQLVAPTPAGARDPVYHVPREAMRDALHCPTTFARNEQPVLLVHGTFTHGAENYDWNYIPELTEQGFDVCYVDLPNRSTSDIQLASEYVVFAIRKLHRLTGMRVDILGHSQGGLQPRWALRWWPSLRNKVSDLVTLATPNHGTTAATFQNASCEACFQMAPASNFLEALNHPDESPGRVSYTNIYSEMQDELVVPATSADTAGATNISIQDVCAGRPVDHISIVADTVVLAMVLDAFTHFGGTVVSRLPGDICTQNPLFPDDSAAAIAILQGNLANPQVPEEGQATEEPPLRGYTTR